jgi:hypothetical protein
LRQAFDAVKPAKRLKYCGQRQQEPARCRLHPGELTKVIGGSAGMVAQGIHPGRMPMRDLLTRPRGWNNMAAAAPVEATNDTDRATRRILMNLFNMDA